jgi:hypothetical protein
MDGKMNFLAGGALVATLAAAWSYVNWSIGYVASVFIVKVKLDSDASMLLLSYFGKTLKRSPLGVRDIRADKKSMRYGGKQWQFFEDICCNNGMFWFGCWPVAYACTERQDAPSEMTLHFIRGTVDLKKMLIEAAANKDKEDSSSQARDFFRVLSGATAQRSSKRTMRYESGIDNSGIAESEGSPHRNPRHVPLTCKVEDIGIDVSSSPTIENMSLSAQAIEFVEFIGKWLQARAWYASRTIPWKIGARLIGPPGTGKTSFVRAISRHYNMPLFLVDLSTMNNNELRAAWEIVKENAPSIALFEDFDGVFHGRDQVNPEGELTFDTVLQCLSGADDASGILTFITTNKPELLDPAIVRPGRAEYEVVMGELGHDMARTIANRIIGDWPELVETIVNSKERWTGAEIQQECITVALEKKKAELSDGLWLQQVQGEANPSGRDLVCQPEGSQEVLRTKADAASRSDQESPASSAV